MRRMRPVTGVSLMLGLLVLPAVALRGADRPTPPTRSDPVPAEIIQRSVAVDNVWACPRLTTLRDGTITAMLFNQPCHGRWEGGVECWSTRDGRSWEKRGTPAPHKPGENRMYVAAGLARDGSLVVLASGWSNRPKAGAGKGTDASLDVAGILPIWVCRSSDQGRTWQQSEEAVQCRSESDGRLLPYGNIVALGDGALGVCLYTMTGAKGADTSLFYVSRDDGRTWSLRGQVQAGGEKTTPVVLPGGRLLAAGRIIRGSNMKLYESVDHGATWRAKGNVTSPMQHPADLTILADGRLLLTYGNRNKGDGRYGVEAKLSSDRGATWSSAPLSLIGDDLRNLDCGYPSSVQLPGGEVLTAYNAISVSSHPRYYMGAVIWKLPAKTAR